MFEWLLVMAGLALGATTCVLFNRLRPRRRAVRPSVTTAAPTGQATIDGPATDWSWSVDPAGLFTSVSASSLELIGYQPSELVGQDVGMIMDPRELGRAEAMVTSLGVTDSGLSDLVISGLHRDGTSSWFALAVSTITDAAGNLVAYQGISRAIGADAAQVVTAQHIRDRIEAIIADKLLITAFQPIVDVASSTVVGAEALSRFVTDRSSTPDIWFADAAGVGLGPELELLAVQTALLAARELPEHLYVSINVSPSTCLDDRLSRMLLASPIDLIRIVLELTEHTEVINYEPLNDVLHGLRLGGLRVAIDDAGSGFASGQHILKINPDIIKLDRSLVTAIESHSGERALAASMVAIATTLGATVTAEGIETRAELRCVTALGVAAAQGYLLGRPSINPHEWARWKSRAPGRALARTTSGDLLVGHGSAGPRALALPRAPGTRTRPSATPSEGPKQPSDRAEPPASSTQRWGHGAPTRDLAIAVLDALPDATAILNSAGTIIAVNRAWRMFSEDNAGDPKSTGVGVNYLDVCARAATAGSADATETLAGLRSVLGGQTVEHEWEYPCHSPTVSRWFISRITSIGDHTGGAVASHVNISRRKRAERELLHLASHDPLTGLANRLLFTAALANALQPRPGRDQRADVGLLYIDLDNFKPVNDAYGHAAGDEMLLVATQRIRSQVRTQDTIARLGGDEFAVCSPRITVNGLVAMADRLTAALAQPHQLQGQQVHMSASIGSYLGAPGEDPADVVNRADAAMYVVKAAKSRPPT